jgi:hypothetical protein
VSLLSLPVVEYLNVLGDFLQIFRHLLAHDTADQLAIEQILQASQVQPAFSSVEI